MAVRTNHSGDFRRDVDHVLFSVSRTSLPPCTSCEQRNRAVSSSSSTGSHRLPGAADNAPTGVPRATTAIPRQEQPQFSLRNPRQKRGQHESTKIWGRDDDSTVQFAPSSPKARSPRKTESPLRLGSFREPSSRGGDILLRPKRSLGDGRYRAATAGGGHGSWGWDGSESTTFVDLFVLSWISRSTFFVESSAENPY